MKNSFLCSYIIPFIYSPQNLKLLKRNIQELVKNPNIEIIIAETGKNSFLKNLDIKAKTIFVESNTWNVSWLYNIGAKYATTDKLIFGEFSLVPNITFVQNVITNDTHDCILGQSHIVYLNEKDSKSFKYPKVDGTEDKLNGVYYYTREAFSEIGYFDENVYGKDVYVLQNKKNDFIKTGLAETKTYKHIVDNIIVENTSEYLNKILGLSTEQMKKYISGQMRKFCDKNKYTIDKTLEYTI